MGWASGSELFDDVIITVKNNVDSDIARSKIYDRLIDAFERHDCDTLHECRGNDPVFDDVWAKRNRDLE